MSNILVAVLGTTPAIITEAYYYFFKRRRPPVKFSEIHVFTTASGRDKLMLTLLGRSAGENHFGQMLKDLRIAANDVTFNCNTIHVFRNDGGVELSDVRTASDSEKVADQICQWLAELRARTDSTIYATIAGGRKTMGLYMAMAMQLLARPQDRLFHVLLDPRLGEPPPREFYYPRNLTIGGQRFRADDIALDCNEVPLLNWPWPTKIPERVSFRAMLDQQQLRLRYAQEPPVIVLNQKKCSVNIGDSHLRLQSRQFFYYYLCAELRSGRQNDLVSIGHLFPAREFGHWWADIRAAWGKKNVLKPGDVLPATIPQDRHERCATLYFHMRNLYAKLHSRDGSVNEVLNAEFHQRLDNDFTLDDSANPKGFLQINSRIKEALKKVISDVTLLDAYIVRKGSEEKAAYGIWLSPERITFLDSSERPPEQSFSASRSNDR